MAQPQSNSPQAVSPSRLEAFKLLTRVIQDHSYANLVLAKSEGFKKLSPLDQRLCTELFYGTLGKLNTLDYFLAQLVKDPLKKLPPAILLILRLGAYQILFADKIPAAAAIDQSVRLAKKYGHLGTQRLVNGVLRNLLRQKDSLVYPDAASDPAAYLAIYYSLPSWLASYWLEQFGPSTTEAICQGLNQTPQLSIRVNTLKTSVTELQNRLNALKISYLPGLVPENIIITDAQAFFAQNLLESGACYVQDSHAMLIAPALGAKPGSTVLDICAAPGGKTTQLAAIMQNKGQILAYDIHAHKIQLIQDNAQRLGATIIKAQLGDATSLSAPPADYLLADVPCSGLGVLGRRKDLRWHKQAQDIATCAALGRQILANAAKLVKPGGILLYATCTITQAENQGNVQWFLQEFPAFNLVPIELNGLTAAQKAQASSGCLQILPGPQGGDGFFMAKLQKSL